MYRVTLYYKFREIADPDQFVMEQRELCERLNLRGRIYIATEGINGTCAGTPAAVEEYQQATEKALGQPLHWKDSDAATIPFARLQVKRRPYLVNMGDDSLLDPHEDGGERLTPEQWKAFLESEQDFTLLDVRNEYEAMVGRFHGATIAPFDSFSEFPEWVENLEADREKPVLMYCTGGIRCEKFSGIVRRKGFKNVYQLDGGILGYAEKFGGEHFDGQCFVFDDRMVVDIGGEADDMARCIHCNGPTSRYLNCANIDCHKLMLCCDSCALEFRGCCCQECTAAPRLRKFTEEHLERPFRKESEEEVVGASKEGTRP